jgi:predicted TIM-barrel fold metal-dependent hydrolase
MYAKSKLALVTVTSAVLLVLSLGTLLIAARTAQVTGQSPFMSWAGFRHMFGRMFATEDQGKLRLAEFAALEPIDVHTHIAQTTPEFVAMLERLHMHVLDILVVNDRRSYRSTLEPQRQDALNFIASNMGHAQLCTTFDPFQAGNSNFSPNAIDGLNQDFQRGAVAVKVWKNIGMEIKDSAGKYVNFDDPIFQPIYQDIAAHNKTLIVHAADPDAAWTTKYVTAGSAKYYGDNPEWDMSKKPDAPQKSAILDARDRLIAMNPNPRVVGAHLGSMEAQLDELGKRLDRYPNFAVDTAARVERLALEPRDQVRAFILKYQDRILYGSDLSFDSEARHKHVTAETWERQYLLDWRYFSRDDTFDYHGHTVEGLNLPLPVLEKLYHDNAIRWIPGIDASAD